MRSRLNVVKGCLFVAALIGLYYLFNVRLSIHPKEIQEFITSFGWISPVIFLVAYTLAPFIYFPSSLLSITASITYGIWPGILYIWTGALGGATSGYFIGRFMGRTIFSKRQIPWNVRMRYLMENRGFLVVLVLRLIPLMGFSMLSYLSGFSKIKYSHFISATMIGIIPGMLMYGTFGQSIVSGSRLLLWIAIAFLFILSAAGFFLRKKIKKWLGLQP
ncbi:hypothetical protein CHL76_12275 [Marinococcus halophilus]|uniref:TVP38/TMEM64 family membrane protein n=1 Tax=Marinococcus halophilus TaxID=1371 RepID=A0A510Y940_MARHA|nr:VTT domain-containing protein [Marinococcus halophilus]OZT79495.1 hypothetical protein CHL76_12275 [Marinococcus halophilus]GEK59201.1 TVP38/TMEM64 family protein [Marinococcus halophilus]